MAAQMEFTLIIPKVSRLVLLENGLQRHYQFKVSITKKRLHCDNFIVIHNICFSLKSIYKASRLQASK